MNRNGWTNDDLKHKELTGSMGWYYLGSEKNSGGKNINCRGAWIDVGFFKVIIGAFNENGNCPGARCEIN